MQSFTTKKSQRILCEHALNLMILFRKRIMTSSRWKCLKRDDFAIVACIITYVYNTSAPVLHTHPVSNARPGRISTRPKLKLPVQKTCGRVAG